MSGVKDSKELFNVKDYVVVVTGGGSGIGLMIAQAFANSGSKVYICGRRKEALEKACKTFKKENGGQMIPIVADITSKESIYSLASTIASKEPHIDLLVNNAGYLRGGKADVKMGDMDSKALANELWNEKKEDWASVYDVLVTGQFFMSVAFMPLLAAGTKANHGRSSSIINISSVAGLTNHSHGQFNYGAAKAAFIHLTRSLAYEFKRDAVQVRVNSIAPGIFPSEMTTGGSDDQQQSHMSAEGFREKKGVPAGRPGKYEDMAQAALMFAVNQYCNGQVLAVDGGYMLHCTC